MSDISKYMSVKEFAVAAGVSVQAIHKAMRQKRISNFQRFGSMYLISQTELETYKAGFRRKGE